MTAIAKAQILRLDVNYGKMFQHVFIPILDRYKVPNENKSYIMSFYIHGIMAVITEWVRKDCKDSMDHIMTVIQHCVMRPERI